MDMVSVESEGLNHPLRRHIAGPTDVEWALIVAKVDSMDSTLKKLSADIEEFGRGVILRCDTCKNADSLKDHESRIRKLEEMLWKGMGAAAIIASLFSFFLNKVFK